MARSKKQTDPRAGTVLTLVEKGNYEKLIGIVQDLPKPEDVRDFLQEKLQITNRDNHRLILVEEIGDYKLFIEITQEAIKSDYDFIVWRLSPTYNPIIKRPSHNDIAEVFLRLRTMRPDIGEYLINACFRLLRDRLSVEKVMNRYFEKLSEELRKELEKFLHTLKWIGLQEDANYPPPKQLGSEMVLAVLALIEFGFEPKDIRRVIRF
jgi:hypothetical protein